MFNIEIKTKTLHFKQPAGTSRGVYRERKIWLLNLTSDEKEGVVGVGECAPLPQLSCDDMSGYEKVLTRLCELFCMTGEIDYALFRPYPSILFGIETALEHWKRGGDYRLSDTAFARGESGIPINGLVWMGSFDEMLSRIDEKVAQGFRCIKLKIGAIDVERELDLVRYVRERYSKDSLELRLDANGAFLPIQLLSILERFAKYDIHSIEQPIARGQYADMAEICRISSIPIALDEELIGINIRGMKVRLLDVVKPQYIILKPTLHGGVYGTKEWIELANERGIGSWITSALESNIGLNSIAHLTATIYGDELVMPQGLGTGSLFVDNISVPLKIRGQHLFFKV